ncbi:MAG: hypothetical protein KA015_04755 [Spirochaetes bacterium]|nr:hypothetical protein [Spirochaetota bacterium]
MIWNTFKNINSIIWNEFKKNKILFVLPVIFAVVSDLGNAYNHYVVESMYDGLIVKGSNNAETLFQFLKEIAEREFLKSGNILTSGFCDWYHSIIFTIICGIIILCLPFILMKIKFKIEGMLFFKIYSWIIWIPVGFGSIALFADSFFSGSSHEIMSLRFAAALSRSMLLVVTLGIASIIFIISLLQIFYFTKFSKSVNSGIVTKDMFRGLLSEKIFKLFIWNLLFAFLMLLLTSVNLIEQMQLMFNTSIISREMINKLYPYQTYLRLLIVPWLILVPFLILKNSSSLKQSIIEGFRTVKCDARQYFGIYLIIFSTVFLIEFIVDWIAAGFSLNYAASVLYVIETILTLYYLIGLFAVYFRKYVYNEEIIVPK